MRLKKRTILILLGTVMVLTGFCVAPVAAYVNDDDPVMGGTLLFIGVPGRSDDNLPGITAGFVVKYNGKYGLITCGHGSKEGWEIYRNESGKKGYKIGKVVKSYFKSGDGAFDACLIEVEPNVKVRGSMKWLVLKKKEGKIPVYGVAEIDSGKPIFYQGYKTGRNELRYMEMCDRFGTDDITGIVVNIHDMYLFQTNNPNADRAGESGSPVAQNCKGFKIGLLRPFSNKVIGLISTTMPEYGIKVQPIMPVLNQLQKDGYAVEPLIKGMEN